MSLRIIIKIIKTFIYYVIEVIPITFIIKSEYKFFAVNLAFLDNTTKAQGFSQKQKKVMWPGTLQILLHRFYKLICQFLNKKKVVKKFINYIDVYL